MQHSKKLLSLALPLMLSAAVSIGAGVARAQSTDAGDRTVAAEDQSQSTQRKHHDLAAYAQKRLDKLKAALSITTEQDRELRSDRPGSEGSVCRAQSRSAACCG